MFIFKSTFILYKQNMEQNVKQEAILFSLYLQVVTIFAVFI